MAQTGILPANEHDAKPIGDRLTIAAINALRSYEYGNASPDLAKNVADRLSAARGGSDIVSPLIYPADITPELHRVLSLMCFQLASFAHIFRAAGAEIKTRAEDEQAYCLHWLIKLVLTYGEGWAEQAELEIAAIRAKLQESK